MGDARGETGLALRVVETARSDESRELDGIRGRILRKERDETLAQIHPIVLRVRKNEAIGAGDDRLRRVVGNRVALGFRGRGGSSDEQHREEDSGPHWTGSRVAMPTMRFVFVRYFCAAAWSWAALTSWTASISRKNVCQLSMMA